MRRIGIFSGTFDPVHIGHLDMAQVCLDTLGLDKVLLMPYGKPLAREPEASPLHRFRMLEMAVSGRKGIEACSADMQKTPRYAVDTVRAVQKLYPDARLVYIIGADKPADIPTWREAGALFGLCDFAVCPRSGYDAANLRDFLIGHGASATLVTSALRTMSSGQIRAKLRLMDDAEGMLEPEISEYIAANGLYQPDYEHMVRQAVSGSRFIHSLGVRKSAAHLARLYGAPVQKAGVAGILHDCAKCMELPRLQAIARRASLVRDPLTLSSNALLHGPVGAEIARLRYHIGDAHILNAIRYHTTGRGGMGLLEMVIFVADAIEPSRNYSGLDNVREQAESDLLLAALTSLTGKRDYVRARGGTESPLTRQAIDQVCRQAGKPG